VAPTFSFAFRSILFPVTWGQSQKLKKNFFKTNILTNLKKLLFYQWELRMEEIEVSSWLTLDALKNEAEIEEIVGDLQSGHFQSVFCVIEDDFLELLYSDSASNYLRRYDDKEEFQLAIEKRKEEFGEALYNEDRIFEEFNETDEDYDYDEDSENY